MWWKTEGGDSQTQVRLVGGGGGLEQRLRQRGTMNTPKIKLNITLNKRLNQKWPWHQLHLPQASRANLQLQHHPKLSCTSKGAEQWGFSLVSNISSGHSWPSCPLRFSIDWAFPNQTLSASQAGPRLNNSCWPFLSWPAARGSQDGTLS